jgi:hypothetical protein
MRKGVIALYAPGATTVAICVASAEGPPFRLMVLPVKTWVVEVPPLLVSVRVAVYSPAAVYMWVVVGVVVVDVLPSPKLQA